MKAIYAAVLLLLFLSGSAAFAIRHEATLEKGKALLNDPKLGTAGKTCNDCHKGRGRTRALR